MEEMKILKIKDESYEVVDEKSRKNISVLEDTISATVYSPFVMPTQMKWEQGTILDNGSLANDSKMCRTEMMLAHHGEYIEYDGSKTDANNVPILMRAILYDSNKVYIKRVLMLGTNGTITPYTVEENVGYIAYIIGHTTSQNVDFIPSEAQEAFSTLNISALKIEFDKKADKSDLAYTDRKADVALELAKGVTYRWEDKTETGMNVAPSGAMNSTLVSADANTEQNGTPTPETPSEIQGTERLDFKVKKGKETVNTFSITPPHPMYKIGNYADKLDVEKGVYEFNNYIKTYDETTESITMSSASAGRNRFVEITSFVEGKIPTTVTGAYSGVKCNLGIDVGYTQCGIKYGIAVTSNGGWIVCFEETKDMTSVTQFKQWLKTHPMTICYTLANGYTEPIPQSDLDLLRQFRLLPSDYTVEVTDQLGRDVTYILKYMIDLREVQ